MMIWLCLLLLDFGFVILIKTTNQGIELTKKLSSKMMDNEGVYTNDDSIEMIVGIGIQEKKKRT